LICDKSTLKNGFYYCIWTDLKSKKYARKTSYDDRSYLAITSTHQT